MNRSRSKKYVWPVLSGLSLFAILLVVALVTGTPHLAERVTDQRAAQTAGFVAGAVANHAEYAVPVPKQSVQGNRSRPGALSPTMHLAVWMVPPPNPFVPLRQRSPTERPADALVGTILATGRRSLGRPGPTVALNSATLASVRRTSNSAAHLAQPIPLNGVRAAVVLPRVQENIPFYRSSQFFVRPSLLRQPISVEPRSQFELASVVLPVVLQDAVPFAGVSSLAQPALSIVREPESAISVAHTALDFSQTLSHFVVATAVPGADLGRTLSVLTLATPSSVSVPGLLSLPFSSGQEAEGLGSSLGSGGGTNDLPLTSQGSDFSMARLPVFVEHYDISFVGVVVGPVNMAILSTRDGVVVVPSGGRLPGTEVFVTSVTADDVVLTAGETSARLKRLP